MSEGLAESASGREGRPQGSDAAEREVLEERAADLFRESVSIMVRLRAPGGCPWDREQSFDSIRKYTLEETYEVLDAIERRHWTDLTEELGDLLLQVLFYAQMARDEGRFSIADVLASLNRKLIRRHPHVFGEEASAAAGNSVSVDAGGTVEAVQVLRNWEAIKQAERTARFESGKPESIASWLDAVPRNFPALLEAAKLGSRAAKVGFDWPDATGLLEKVEEECGELRAEMAATVKPSTQAVEGEVGDLLFTVVNLARHLSIDPEMALRGTNRKFRQRFAAMETVDPVREKEKTPAEWDALWRAAKEKERAQPSPTIELRKESATR